jgi:hypothetical protein
LNTTVICTHVSIAQLRAVHERTHPARRSRFSGATQPPAPLPPDAEDDDLASVPAA